MSKKIAKYLIPSYMRDFSCIGSDCEDCCCKDWHIGIDRNTYKKYKNIKDVDKDFRDKIKNTITRVRTNATDRNYAKIELDATGHCPFLSNDKLCELQMKYGENSLSKICLSYPRVYNVIDGNIEKSTVISCPEAARLILLNPEGIEFDEKDDSLDQCKNTTAILDTQCPSLADQPARYLWELRIFTIGLLQNREYPIADRLIILGMFYLDIQELVEKGKVDDIPQVIDTFKYSITSGELREPLSEVPNLYQIQLKYLNIITEHIVKKNNKRYLECYNEFIAGLEYSEDANTEKVIANYTEGFNKYYLPFMAKHEYILENYLVNYVFNTVFPFGNYPSVYDEYIMLTIHFALIKFHLIGMARYHKGLTEELVVKLIQSFAKNFEHNRPTLRTLLKILKKVDNTKMSDMMILIKN